MMFLKYLIVFVYFALSTSDAQLRTSPSSKNPSFSETFETGSNNDEVADVNFKYIFSNPSLKVNWHKARDLCEMFGLELASITSESEYTAFKDAFKTTGFGTRRIWLGGSDLASEGSFVWASSPPTPFFYTHWQPNEPNNGDNGVENCVEIYSNEIFGWNDAPCNFNLMFACKNPHIN